MEYGVGVTNRYAFLDDDVEDNPTIVEQQTSIAAAATEKKPLVKKTDKPAQGKVVKGKATELSAKGKEDSTKADRTVPVDKSSSGRGEHSSGRGRGGGGRNPRTTDNNSRFGEDLDKENHEEYNNTNNGSGRGVRSSRGSVVRGGKNNGYNNDSVADYDESVYDGARDFNSRSETNYRGRGSRGGSRGGGGGPGGFTRRRDHDRASGSDRSGVKSVDKRDGAGAHNWGTYKDELDDNATEEDRPEINAPEDLDNQAENGQGDSQMNNAQSEGEEVKTVEEEAKLLTLEQWKAMQQPRQTPEFNIRKANEGEDPSKWKNLVLKKKEIQHDDDELEYEEGEDIYAPQRAGRQKLITDIGFHFIDDREERGFRRGPPRHISRPAAEGTENMNGERGGRGGRGRGRGSSGGFSGRGVGRGAQRRTDRYDCQRVPVITDEDFPSLIC